MELVQHNDNITNKEKNVELIRNTIRNTGFREDLEIENDKKLLIEKMALNDTNEDILVRKIKESR